MGFRRNYTNNGDCLNTGVGAALYHGLPYGQRAFHIFERDTRLCNLVERVLQDLSEKKGSDIEKAKRKYSLNLRIRPVLRVHAFHELKWK